MVNNHTRSLIKRNQRKAENKLNYINKFILFIYIKSL